MNQDANVKTYCIYCDVNRDNETVRYLEQFCQAAYSFQQTRRFFTNGKSVQRNVPLLPRYVFFDMQADEAPDWLRVRAIPHVQKVLQYADGERALRAEDLAFVEWMKGMQGLLALSQVFQVGTRIRVVGGPLKQYEGSIVEVKKHRNMVAIEVGENAYFSKIWCPIEYVERLV